jgi:hypothetical protein
MHLRLSQPTSSIGVAITKLPTVTREPHAPSEVVPLTARVFQKVLTTASGNSQGIRGGSPSL